MSEAPAVLWHWTCDDAAARILAQVPARVDPLPQIALGGPALLWLTEWDDLDDHRRDALGLTHRVIGTCDRTAWRLRVDAVPGQVEAWTAWAHRRRLPGHVRARLEAAEGAEPRAWWVAEVPLLVLGADRMARP